MAAPKHALHLRLHLKKSPSLSDEIKEATVRAVLFHVLYSRGVVPMPAEELLRIYEERQQRAANSEVNEKLKRLTKSDRKIMKFGGQLSCFLSDLHLLFGTGQDNGERALFCCNGTNSSEVRCVVITLGPSFASPREQYVIRFHSQSLEDVMTSSNPCVVTKPYNMEPEAPPTSLLDAKAVSRSRVKVMERELSRRFVREFLRGTLDPKYAFMFSASSCSSAAGSSRYGSLKVNVAVLLRDNRMGWNMIQPRCTMSSNEEENLATDKTPICGTKGDMDGGYETNHNTLSNRLVVRRNFVVRVPRMISKKKERHRPFVVLDVVPSFLLSSNPLSVMNEGAVDNSDSSAVYTDDFHVSETDTWVSLRSTLKGFRT